MKDIKDLEIGTFIWLCFADSSIGSYCEILNNGLSISVVDLADGKSFPIFGSDKYTFNILWVQRYDKITFENSKESKRVF